jgi:hypothetical protein
VWWSQNPYQAFEHGIGLPKSKFITEFHVTGSTAFLFFASEAGIGNIYLGLLVNLHIRTSE